MATPSTIATLPPTAAAPAPPPGLSPGRRAWRRFQTNRMGYVSLIIFIVLFGLSLMAEVLSNDKPLLVRYQGDWYVPVVQTLPETTFGGDFPTPTDYLDPDIHATLAKPGNFSLFPPNPYHHQTINYFSQHTSPAPPDSANLLGTDDKGRDLLARLLYGFRISVVFALIVTAMCTIFGVMYGSVQGYFAGWTDIGMERFHEIWGAMPTLYMLIIFAALFSPSFWLLVILLSLFGWMGIASYVRAEFLRNRTLDYVRASRALGQSNRKIMFRHILPNSLTPVVTLIPFEMAAAIGSLTSLDFLGLGVPPGTPSLGELLNQAKENLDAWWIAVFTFAVLVVTLLLLILIGDALRDALDPRKVLEGDAPVSLLEVRDLTVEFGTKRVVDRVSFAVDAGEKFALVGESGSGKTITALSLLNLVESARTSGQVIFKGSDVLKMPELALRDLRGRDIAMIFQEPMTALNPIYSVGKQIVESLHLHEKLSAAEAATRAVELLRRTGVPEPERRCHSYPHQLSGGQRQRAMIAMALACRPKLLIADEPTTALDVTIQAQILDLLAELQREFGMAVILITHDLNLVKRFAERVGVMQAGQLVETGSTAAIFNAPQHEYTRLLLASRPQRIAVPLVDNPPRLLEVEKLNCVYPIKRGWFGHDDFYAVRDASLALKRGETLGIVGESGSGKTTLGLAALRLQRSTGAIHFDGTRLDELSQGTLRPLRKRMQVVFQDPFSSLSPRRTIEQIVGEGLELHFPELDAPARRRQVIAGLEEVGLEASMLNRYPHEFSGGQRQRIAIARVAVLKPDFLVLDEPTSSLDATVQRQVLTLLVDLQQRLGMSYLFISHDLAVIRAVAHRVVVMKDGRIVESGETATILSKPEHPYTRELLAAAAV